MFSSGEKRKKMKENKIESNMPAFGVYVSAE